MVPTDAIILDESVAKACAADTSSASLDSVQISDSITIKVQSSKKSIMYKLSKVRLRSVHWSYSLVCSQVLPSVNQKSNVGRHWRLNDSLDDLTASLVPRHSFYNAKLSLGMRLRP